MLISNSYKNDLFINFIPELNSDIFLSKKSTVSWDELFTEIRFLWDRNNENDNETKLEDHIKNLDQFLSTREQPPSEIILKYCKSGLFVDMFRSMKTTKYRSYILNIICQIIHKFPVTLPVFIERDLSASFNQFLFSEGITESMQIEAPFYTAKYLKCISKSTISQPYLFFFQPTEKGTYFQLCIEMIQKAFSLEEATAETIYHHYIQKTETKIFTIFTKLIPSILKNEIVADNENLQQIFRIFSTAFEMKLCDTFPKLIKSLYEIWTSTSCQLTSYFINDSIISPLISLINEQFQPAQQYSIRLISELSFVEPQILSQIDPLILFATANDNFSLISANYSDITKNSLKLLGQKIEFDNGFDFCKFDLNILFGMCDASLCDMNYEAHEAVAYFLFSLIKVGHLPLFCDETNSRAQLIIDAFQCASSQESRLICQGIDAATKILYMTETGDEFAATFSPTIQEFLEELMSMNDKEVYSESINHLYDKYFKS